MGEARRRRLAFNEALARDANEAIEGVAGSLGHEGDTVEFRCECVDPDCEGVVRLTLAEYATVRERPTRFVVLDGHEDPEVEVVAGYVGAYALVEKTGPEGREVAEATDERSS